MRTKTWKFRSLPTTSALPKPPGCFRTRNDMKASEMFIGVFANAMAMLVVVFAMITSKFVQIIAKNISKFVLIFAKWMRKFIGVLANTGAKFVLIFAKSSNRIVGVETMWRPT